MWDFVWERVQHQGLEALVMSEMHHAPCMYAVSVESNMCLCEQNEVGVP